MRIRRSLVVAALLAVNMAAAACMGGGGNEQDTPDGAIAHAGSGGSVQQSDDGGAGQSVGASGANSGTSACPPGIPPPEQLEESDGTGGCENGTGAAALGERCIDSSDCSPGTFCLSHQCTVTCRGGRGRFLQAERVDCEEAFGFAECVVWAQMPLPEESVHYCAPTCAKDEDCSVGASCEVGQVAVVDRERSYRTQVYYTWEDTDDVCKVE